MKDRCRDVLDALVESATGPVPPRERERIIEHLAVCDRCRREAAAIEATVADLRAAGQFAVPPGFWPEFTHRLNDRVAAERVPPAERFRRWVSAPRHAWGVAAATAATVVAIFGAVRLGQPPSPEHDPLAARARSLVTATMSSTLPSLGEMLDTMGAGMALERDLAPDRTSP